MITFEFTGWTKFRAQKKPQVVRKWLRSVGKEAQRVFTAGMRGGHSGQLYYRRGRVHQASAPDEYPANDTGGLLASMRHEVSSSEVVIGTNVFYSAFLRNGTRKMRRRRMSDDALKAGIKNSHPQPVGWVAWTRGRT